MVGELESLSTHEPLTERIARHDYDRLIMLSDGVFAIAITLLALEMKIPETWDGSLQSLLHGTGRSLIGYLFGFVLVGAFWMTHRRIFAKLVRVDRVVTGLNIVLLGFVGLVPFIAELIGVKGPTRAIPVYLLLTGAIFGAYALIYACAGLRRLLHPDVETAHWRREVLGLSIAAAIILGAAAACLLFGVVPSQGMLVAVAIGAAIAGRLATRRSAHA